MNTVRQAIRGALIDGARPADALRRANRVLLRSDRPGVVTALVGIIDPATLQFRYAAAGHPAPLLAIRRRIPAHRCRAKARALRWASFRTTSRANTVSIPIDGVLALYTDGCADDPGNPASKCWPKRLSEARTLAPSKPALTIDSALFGRARTHRRRDHHHDHARSAARAPRRAAAGRTRRVRALARTALRRFLAVDAAGRTAQFRCGRRSRRSRRQRDRARLRPPAEPNVHVRARFEDRPAALRGEDARHVERRRTAHDARPRHRDDARTLRHARYRAHRRAAPPSRSGFQLANNLADVSLVGGLTPRRDRAAAARSPRRSSAERNGSLARSGSRARAAPPPALRFPRLRRRRRARRPRPAGSTCARSARSRANRPGSRRTSGRS